MKSRTTIALFACLVPLGAAAQAYDLTQPCSMLTNEEVNAWSNVPASKTRATTTRAGNECTWVDAQQKAVFILEVRPAKLPKAELDVEAENLQKIYRTSVKPVEVGQGGFWLNSKYELFFRKGRNIVRVVVPGASPKQIEANSLAAAKMIETRLPK
jgi:hypothetical protein